MATPKKRTDEEIQDAVLRNTTIIAAAKELSMNERTVRRRLTDLRKRGFAPENPLWRNVVPEGFSMRGVSTMVTTPDGKPQWLKAVRDEEYFLKVMDEIKSAFANELPRYKPTAAPPLKDTDGLSLYMLSDYHLGMLSWMEETGADWDLDIASETLMRWFNYAAKVTPDSHTGLFCNLGDFLHIDNLTPATPTSGNVLDADTRFQKLVRTTIQLMRYAISLMLDKHQHVHIINAEGNHDQASSIWLREMLHVVYENEPRVTVELSPDPYYAYEWGETSLFFHHGHKCRFGNLDRAFAAKFRKLWGRTEYSYGHVGHLHHKHILESSLMELMQWNTLAAPDAYATRGAWLSKRMSGVQVYNKLYGMTEQKIITPKMLGMV